jgi:hypothetical protein
MADASNEKALNWLAAEDDIWETLRKREQRKRDFIWLLISLLLLLVGNLTGRFFGCTHC